MIPVLDIVPDIPNWLGLAIIVVVLMLLLLGYTIGSRITGFGPHVVRKTITSEYGHDQTPGKDEPEKKTVSEEVQTPRTFWDWMTVLLISAVIGGVGLIFTLSQSQKQQQIQNQQAKDAILQTYLDQMTQMLLDNGSPLRDSEPGDEERVVARVRTVTALKTLDGEHNKIATTFLKEAGLVSFSVPGDQKEESVVRLDKAPLNGVRLTDNNLGGVNLRFAQLREAKLHGANLAIANLSFADLAGAILTDADLRGTGLAFANLAGANLEGANLSDTALRGADLRGAKLTNANGLTQYQINQAGAGDSKTELPKGLDRPKWWTNNSGAIVREPMTVPILPDSMLEDSQFGASLIALKSLSSELRDEIRIPKKVGNMNGTATGALVYDVRPGSPADSAGFRAGDVIVKVGENQVQDLEDLKRTLEQDHAGTRVKFGTWRYYFPQGWRKGELYSKLGD